MAQCARRGEMRDVGEEASAGKESGTCRGSRRARACRRGSRDGTRATAGTRRRWRAAPAPVAPRTGPRTAGAAPQRGCPPAARSGRRPPATASTCPAHVRSITHHCTNIIVIRVYCTTYNEPYSNL